MLCISKHKFYNYTTKTFPVDCRKYQKKFIKTVIIYNSKYAAFCNLFVWFLDDAVFKLISVICITLLAWPYPFPVSLFMYVELGHFVTFYKTLTLHRCEAIVLFITWYISWVNPNVLEIDGQLNAFIVTFWIINVIDECIWQSESSNLMWHCDNYYQTHIHDQSNYKLLATSTGTVILLSHF